MVGPDLVLVHAITSGPVVPEAVVVEIDSKHIWSTTVLDDSRIECRWVSVARSVGGHLMALSGIEHATLDDSGLITTCETGWSTRAASSDRPVQRATQ